MIVVSDTSPVRALISIGKIELLNKLFEKILIPHAVKDELQKINSSKFDLDSVLKKNWFVVQRIQNMSLLDSLKRHLDEGESEAIILAKEKNCNLVLMDENKGRKIAKSMGLEVLGLVGILIIAKSKGHLTLIKPLLDELRNNYGFWLNEKFYRKILKSQNEAI